MGMVFIDLHNAKVVRLNPTEWWDGYVMVNFSEYSSYFPSQEEIFNMVQDGGVFHGPFAGWEDE